MSVIVLNFEDHGQDFLTWHVDQKGNIIKCEPFQFSIWSQWTLTTKEFKAGGKVTIQKADETLTIKYPIESFTTL